MYEHDRYRYPISLNSFILCNTERCLWPKIETELTLSANGYSLDYFLFCDPVIEDLEIKNYGISGQSGSPWGCGLRI